MDKLNHLLEVCTTSRLKLKVLQCRRFIISVAVEDSTSDFIYCLRLTLASLLPHLGMDTPNSKESPRIRKEGAKSYLDWQRLYASGLKEKPLSLGFSECISAFQVAGIDR